MKLIALIMMTLTSLACATVVHAGEVDFDLSWHSIDGGGGTSAFDGFELSGTIGQPDAGTMISGVWSLAGAFWAGGGVSAPFHPADFDGSGGVGNTDLIFLLADWGACPDCDDCRADLDGDCVVGHTDLITLLAAWGPHP